MYGSSSESDTEETDKKNKDKYGAFFFYAPESIDRGA